MIIRALNVPYLLTCLLGIIMLHYRKNPEGVLRTYSYMRVYIYILLNILIGHVLLRCVADSIFRK